MFYFFLIPGFYLRMAYSGRVGKLNQFSVPFMLIVEYWLLTLSHTEAERLPTQPCALGNLLSVPTERKEGVTKVQVMCCVRCAGHQRFLNILAASSRLYDLRGFKATAVCPYCCKVNGIGGHIDFSCMTISWHLDDLLVMCLAETFNDKRDGMSLAFCSYV